MELSQDWRQFQTVFFPNKRTLPLLTAQGGAGSVLCVHENGMVLSAFADGEDFSGFTGSSVEELRTKIAPRGVVAIDRATVDSAIHSSVSVGTAVDGGGYLEQVEFLRKDLVGKGAFGSGKGVSTPFRGHFLLDGLKSWWGKVLPSSFGLYVRLMDGAADAPVMNDEIVLIIKRGQICGYGKPELTSMGREKASNPMYVVNHLSDRLGMKVQGIVVSTREWKEWGAQGSPWKPIAASVRAGKTKLFPFRWSVAFLLATRAFLRF